MVLNIVSFHPCLGKWSNLTSIFFSNGLGWNHQLEFDVPFDLFYFLLRQPIPKAFPTQPDGRQDVLGFARLNRASLVVDAMASCPKAKWKSFISEPWVGVRNHKKNLGPGGGFKDFLFSRLLGEDSQFDYYFSNGLKPLTRKDERICQYYGKQPEKNGRLG